GEDPGEPVHLEPDDLLLPPDPAVIRGEPAGSLADGQPVFDHPGEIARRDAGCPLALHGPAFRPGGPTRVAACKVGATSCTRTMPAPWCMAQVAVASEPASRPWTGA